MATWNFLTNHTHVLLCVWEDPEARVRDIAARVGITERAVQRILQELEAAGYLRRERVGRRNRYRIHADRSLRHPIQHRRTVSALLALVDPPKRPRPSGGAAVRRRSRARSARARTR